MRLGIMMFQIIETSISRLSARVLDFEKVQLGGTKQSYGTKSDRVGRLGSLKLIGLITILLGSKKLWADEELNTDE